MGVRRRVSHLDIVTRRDEVFWAFEHHLLSCLATGYEPGLRWARGFFLTCREIYEEVGAPEYLSPELRTKLGVHLVALRDLSRRYRGVPPQAMRYWRELGEQKHLVILADSTVTPKIVVGRIHAMQDLTQIVLDRILVRRKDQETVFVDPAATSFFEKHVAKLQHEQGSEFCDPRHFLEEVARHAPVALLASAETGASRAHPSSRPPPPPTAA